MGHTFPISSDQSAQSSEPTTASALPHEMPSPSRLALLSMRKHPRYISEFEEDVIRIDITLPNAKEQDDPYIIDLKEIYIPAIGGVNDTVPLTFFPHWTDAIKATVNVSLRRYAVNTYLGSRIARLISELLQFCAYCLINSRAYFSSVTPADIEDLSSSLAYLGWYQALGMDLLFDRVIEKARIDETFRHRIATPSPERAQSVRLNIHVIAQYLGIRVNGYIPRRVYQALSEQLGLEPGGQHAGEEQPTEWSPGRFRSTIDAINMLATLPAGMDRLSFFPFPDANKLAETLSNKEAGRTENITIDEACKLLKTSLELVYGHSVGVIALGEALRKRLEEDRHKGLDSVYSAAELHNYLKSIYPEIRDQYSLPWPELGRITNGSDKEDKPSFLDLIRAVQMGAFTLIGISHGRRKNELLGERSRPYGLYFGCVEAIDPAAQIFKLDVYIEKTIQDWDQFYCNKLIADAVKVLEELSQLFRPIGAARVAANADVDKARAEKLFRYKRFSLEGLSGKWIQWDYFVHSQMFFEMAGLSGSAIDHTAHPFRRLFGIIYYYRYSNRLLQALQRHYRHKDFFTPFTYIFDPKKREQARSIEEQWKFSKEQEVLEQGLQEVGEEVFRQVVQEILEGKPHGGGFPKEVRRFYARLAENAEFNAMDLSEQAGTISVRLLKRGHFPMVFPHGGCTAGSCDSIDRGNCYSAADDELHREMASIETCHGCRFHFTNEDYLSNLDFQLGRLRAEADDPDRSLAEQRASQRVADNLAEMIDLERRMAIRQAERMKDVLSKGYKTDAKEE